MNLLSNDLEQGKGISQKFTCDGENASPELHWENFPEETRGFALTVRDPDAPSGDFVHWLLCNIPAETTGIPQASVPPGSKQVANDFGQENYGGPCPPSGTHRYFFKVFALDVERIECNSKQEFFSQIEQHKLAEAGLMATYRRK